jgi:phage gp36-like protein
MANAYCNISQLEQLYDIRVVIDTSDDSASNNLNASNVNLCLDIAASKLEAVLYNRYPLPLPSVPPVLTGHVAALAMQRLYARRSDLPKGIKADIDEAQQFLKDLTMGLVGIPGVDRSGAPVLAASGTKDGSSRFDNLAGLDQSGSTSQDNVAKGKAGRLSGFPNI